MSEIVSRPPRGERFSIGPVRHEGERIIATFSCSRFGTFTEPVDVGEGHVPQGLLRLLQVALGVSTYKAAAATKIDWPRLTPGGRAMAEALYSEGLAEFFVRSGLNYPAATEFSGKVDEVAGSGDPRTGSPLVAFGGGKDSYVAGTIAEMAFGEQPTFASVILADTVGAVLTRTAPHPPRLIKRRLDPKLLSLNGAFNGHVPITAINILVLTIVGLLEGRGPILFANERSADEPTMVLAHGTEANHQYSKSSAFEKLVRQAVTEVSPSAPQVFSVLRPFSELWIGQQFAKIESAFGRFTSCNRNFRLASDADKRWCGACAKCAFTSLILAPFISREQALTIFGRIMLDQQALLPFYRELLGLSEQKPWDCVGTISESQAALYLASKKADWDTTLVMRELLPELMQLTNPESLDRQATDALKAEPAGALPRDLYQAAMEMSS